MRTLLTFFVFLPFLSFAQVGVNTTAPNAALDIQSTNNGVLIPRVQLTDALDIVTVVNPAGGVLAKSTLVYNFGISGIAPDNVIDGFYYWNGARWVPISGNTAADSDWHEVGTTTPPDAITDDMFHMGNVAIGKNTADYPLEINTTNFPFGLYNVLNNNNTTNQQKATIKNEVYDNTNDPKYGIINTVTNNSITSGGIGVRNNISGDGTTFFGNSNYVTAGSASNGADIIGIRNDLATDSNNGSAKGAYNIFSGTSGNLNFMYGAQNDFRASANRKFGTYNTFNADTAGFNIGLYNSLSTDLALNDQYGVWNNFTTGALTNGDNYGSYNFFSGDGIGSKIGSYTRIDSNGNGQHIGSMQLINGSAAGLGTKYGTKAVISSTAGGTHYGIHSTVLKPGATNFAGYFLGNVGIGTTALNTYTFPPSRGTNDQIMQTDGSGNVTWRNPNFWSLNGNTATNPPAIIGTPIATTENFIGTTDNKNLVLGANNIGRMNITAFGNVGIGVDNPFAKFHVFENAAPGGVAVYIRQNSTGAVGSNTALVVNSVSTTANKVNYAAEFAATGSNLQRNVGALFSASGATKNHAIIVPTSSGNIGFGTSNPDLAHLQVEGMIGNTTALFRNNGTSQGISLAADWPGLYFNSYYNAGQRTMAPNGYPSIINTDQSSGGLTFHTSNTANTTSDALISVPERMRIDANGNVGIGTVSPTQPLHVYKNSNTTKNVIFAEAIQTNIGPDFQNRGVVGYASGVPATSGFGFAVGVMGIGDKANSYYATGVYAHLGSAPPNLYDGNQALYANGNNLGLAGVFVGGDVVIGASSSNASAALNINSTTKGVTFPRMTRAQRNAIVLPLIGLMIFQTDFTPGLRVYNGTNWMRFSEIID